MLLGYEIALAGVYASLILMLAFIVMDRRELRVLLRKHISRYSLAALALILAFFLIVSLLYVSPVEQLYFDENIYQARGAQHNAQLQLAVVPVRDRPPHYLLRKRSVPRPSRRVIVHSYCIRDIRDRGEHRVRAGARGGNSVDSSCSSSRACSPRGRALRPSRRWRSR